MSNACPYRIGKIWKNDLKDTQWSNMREKRMKNYINRRNRPYLRLKSFEFRGKKDVKDRKLGYLAENLQIDFFRVVFEFLVKK